MTCKICTLILPWIRKISKRRGVLKVSYWNVLQFLGILLKFERTKWCPPGMLVCLEVRLRLQTFVESSGPFRVNPVSVVYFSRQEKDFSHLAFLNVFCRSEKGILNTPLLALHFSLLFNEFSHFSPFLGVLSETLLQDSCSSEISGGLSETLLQDSSSSEIW